MIDFVKFQPGDSTRVKQAWRRDLLAQRRSLPPARWQAYSRALCGHLQSSERFQQAETLLAFFSVSQEPDLSQAWESPSGRSKRWAFPCCVGQGLEWYRWQPGDPWVEGAFGIREPCRDGTPLDPATADLILVPAVACDRQGNRLGYGGGFYDRLLSRSDCAHIPTIGLVFDFAWVEHLPTDPWDRPLNAVCTEQGLFEGLFEGLFDWGEPLG